MPVSRRKFLQNGAVAAAVLAAAPLPAWSGAQPSSADVHPASHNLGRVHGLDRTAFERAVGSAFQVSTGQANAQPVWLTLLKVEDPPALAPVNTGIMAVPPPKSNTSAVTSGFVLTFQSSAPPLAQGTYTFRHEALGEFPLFIVPGTTGTYLAVFNILLASTTSGLTPPRVAPPRPKGLGWRADSAGTSSSGIAAGSGSSAVNSAGGLSGGRPAQELEEPVFRNRPEPKLPE